MGRSSTALYKLKPACKSLLEATRGKFPRGASSFTDKAVETLGSYTAGTTWRANTALVVLASLYLEGRDNSPLRTTFKTLPTLRAAVLKHGLSYSKADREWVCSLLAVPEYFDNSYASAGMYESCVRDEYTGSESLSRVPRQEKAAGALLEMSKYWLPLDVSMASVFSDGLLSFWLEYHSDLWTLQPSEYLKCMDMSKKDHASKMFFMVSVLGHEEHVGALDPIAVEGLCKGLALDVSEVTQRNAARKASDLKTLTDQRIKYSDLVHAAAPVSVKNALCDHDKISKLVTVVSRTKGVAESLVGNNLRSLYATAICDFGKVQPVERAAAALEDIGLDLGLSEHVQGLELKPKEVLNGVRMTTSRYSYSYSYNDQQDAKDDMMTTVIKDAPINLALVLETMRADFPGVKEHLVNVVMEGLVMPATSAANGLAEATGSLATDLRFFIDELSRRKGSRDNPVYSYSNKTAATRIKDLGKEFQEAARRLIDSSEKSSCTELIGLLLEMAECLAYAYTINAIASRKDDDSLPTAMIQFGD